MSIENMKASQADWTKTAFNLPVTDMQNTVTALTSAISEMQTETGLTSDTMDSLRTQFSDLKDAHVDCKRFENQHRKNEGLSGTTK